MYYTKRNSHQHLWHTSEIVTFPNQKIKISLSYILQRETQTNTNDIHWNEIFTFPNQKIEMSLSCIIQRGTHTNNNGLHWNGLFTFPNRKKCLSHVLYKEIHTPTLMAYIGNFHIPKPNNRNVSLIYHTK